MSAIYGILRFDGSSVRAADLERMGNALAHRGPNGHKFAVDGPAGLGHGLMRVNNEDLFEVQPLFDREADLTLVADCRIDNREELAEAFAIHATDLCGMPDSALILRAYRTWGERCAEHLLGDFAFAIWNGRTRELVLGRDHMGQRYVHYHRGKDFFAFATEIKALWTLPDVPRALSESQLGRLLLMARPAGEGETLFTDIYGLPGAMVMTIGEDCGVAMRRYWQPQAAPAHLGQDEAYYVDAYRRVLGEAVACRLRRTIRPPGLFFSGGYDSAAIAGLAESVLATQGRKLVAAASVMPAGYRGTIRHARRWVEMCARDMPHLDIHYVTRDGRNALSGLREAFGRTGLPTGPQHFAMNEMRAVLAANGAQVVMDGHGGDSTLNPRAGDTLARLLATAQFRRFAEEFAGHLRVSGHSLWTTLKTDIAAHLLPPTMRAAWRRVRHGPVWRNGPINQCFAERLIADGILDGAGQFGERAPGTDSRDRMRRTLLRSANGAMPGGAAGAAIHGLELTRPFRDRRVVELALAVPQALDVRHGRNRYLACAGLKDLYPREFQTRWRKNDDPIPDFLRMTKSIESELQDEIARLERSSRLRGYFDFAKIRRLLAAREAGDHNSGWEPEPHGALLGIVLAQYVEWFNRENR